MLQIENCAHNTVNPEDLYWVGQADPQKAKLIRWILGNCPGVQRRVVPKSSANSSQEVCCCSQGNQHTDSCIFASHSNMCLLYMGIGRASLQEGFSSKPLARLGSRWSSELFLPLCVSRYPLAFQGESKGIQPILAALALPCTWKHSGLMHKVWEAHPHFRRIFGNHQFRKSSFTHSLRA